MSETPEWLDEKGKIIEHRYCRRFLEKQPIGVVMHTLFGANAKKGVL